MRMYRTAILGCRARGAAAARAYAAHARTELVALCDLLPERSAALGDELGVAARYTDLDAMLLEARPDVVAIPTGTEFHFDLCRRVLEAGAHVDVEKPLCTDLEQADALIALAERKGLRIAVHHQSRVGASMRAVAGAIAEGRVGAVRHVLGSCKGYYGGYGLMNIGTHWLNNLVELLGPCRAVSAVGLTGGRPVTPQDVTWSAGGMGIVAGERITATLEFAGGVTATGLFHRFPVVDNRAYCFEVLGTEGRLLWRTSGAWWLPHAHFAPDGERDRWEPLALEQPDGWDPAGPADPAELAYVEELARALDEDRPHRCSGEDARHALEIIMGMFDSMAGGGRVSLPQSCRKHPLVRWRREARLGEPPPVPRPYAEWLAAEDARVRGRAAA